MPSKPAKHPRRSCFDDQQDHDTVRYDPPKSGKLLSTLAASGIHGFPEFVIGLREFHLVGQELDGIDGTHR